MECEWGGKVPIGYERENKKLIIDQVGAEKVQFLFKKYVHLQSVPKLKEYLKTNQILTNSGKDFGKGQLYHILSNKIYIGKITHKDKVYEGEHQAIIDESLFEQTQKLLQENTINKSGECGQSNSLLAGFLYDDKDNRTSPSHSNTRKKKYRYYLSQAISKLNRSEAGTINKIPATEIENFVRGELLKILKSEQTQSCIAYFDISKQKEILKTISKLERLEDKHIRAMLYKVKIYKDKLVVLICRNSLVQTLESIAFDTLLPPAIKKDSTEFICLEKEIRITVCASKGKSLVINSGKNEANYNMNLIKAIIRSHYWHNLLLTGKCKTITDIQKLEGLNDTKYLRQILELRYLDVKFRGILVSKSLKKGRHYGTSTTQARQNDAECA